MMVGIKSHMIKPVKSIWPYHNLVHYLITFNIFVKFLYYFIKSSITIGWIILLQWQDKQGTLAQKKSSMKKKNI